MTTLTDSTGRLYGPRKCKCGRTILPHEVFRSCGRCIRLGELRRHRIKNDAFNAYGGYVCSCCRETMELALQIDHIYNDGAEHRKDSGCGTGDRFYKWLKDNKYPPGFQVLCANCNIAKQLNGGICPHQERFDMKANLTDISVVLDRSGSMSDCHLDTIEAFNKFITEQQKEPGDCYLTLAQFDNEYELVHNGLPIRDVPLLNTQTYVPRGSTALLDAIGRTITATGARLAAMAEDDRPSNVLFVILTDGQENASSEFHLQQVRDMIKRQTEVYNWHFVFLGADQDAIAAGTSIGVAASSSLGYGKLGPKGASGPSGTVCAVAAVNAAVKNYRNTKGLSRANFFEGTESLQAGDDLDNQVVKPATETSDKDKEEVAVV